MQNTENKITLSFKILFRKILWIIGIVVLIFLIFFGIFQSSFLIFLSVAYNVISYILKGLSLVNYNPKTFYQKMKQRLFDLQNLDFETLKALLKIQVKTIVQKFSSYNIKEEAPSLNNKHSKPSSDHTLH